MENVFFAISAYIFMRAFEVLCSGQKNRVWYQRTMPVIACAVLYTSVAAMLVFYFKDLHWLGFDPQ